MHRAAAIVFIVTAGLQIVLTIRNRRLRHHWSQLLPKRSDLREAVHNFAWNVGFPTGQPARASHSYIEKAEYWAVVWGFIVMAGSGALLWANKWALRFLPKTALDAATAVHFYEAVLAAAAILIWHFYFVIVDPEVYPMDTAWLTGKSVRRGETSRAKSPGGARFDQERSGPR